MNLGYAPDLAVQKPRHVRYACLIRQLQRTLVAVSWLLQTGQATRHANWLVTFVSRETADPRQKLLESANFVLKAVRRSGLKQNGLKVAMVRPLIFVFLLLFPHTVYGQARVAFLVGNSEYQYTASLDNPVADVEMLAETLRELDFDVRLHTNLTRKEIGKELSQFLRETQDAEVTMFYFAGHGIQLDGKNYLIGVDAQLATELDVESEALNLDSVVKLLERNSRAAMVFVDACRNNPLAEKFYRENYSETRAVMTRGLAPVNTAFDGTMLAFSASPGQVAYDGEVNSPFALALNRHLATENIEILSVMKRVIRDVKSMTNNLQTPMLVNDLSTEIYLNLGSGDAGAGIAYAQEEAMFEAAMQMQSPRAWSIYFDRFPTGFFKDMAVLEQERLNNQILASDAGIEIEIAGATNSVQETVTPQVASKLERALGMSKEEAREIQAALNSLGYGAGVVDGALGRKSRKAIADFQLVANLPSTGVVTQATAKALGVTLAVSESSDTPVYSSRDARKYDPEKLALFESDERLLGAIRALQQYELRYGYFEGNIYLVVLTWGGLSWEKAIALAKSVGGHLATMNSAQENTFVFDLAKYDKRLWRISTNGDSYFGPAFGFYQVENAREPDGGWVWVTGEPVTFTGWRSSEPNNYQNNEGVASFVTDHEPKGFQPSTYWNDMPGIDNSIVIEIE